MNAFIAQKLDHVLYFERDSLMAKEGEEVPNPYQTMISKVDGPAAFSNFQSNITKREYRIKVCIEFFGFTFLCAILSSASNNFVISTFYILSAFLDFSPVQVTAKEKKRQQKKVKKIRILVEIRKIK